MFRKKSDMIPILVKAMDIVNFILGILAIVFAVIVMINADANVGFIPNVLLCAGIMNLLLSIKKYLQDEYRSFFIHLIVGGVITIIGIILRIMM